MTHGRAQQHTITIGGSRDGNVEAYRLVIVQDAAYPKIGAVLPSLTILMATGPYVIPKAEAIAKVVVTNTTRSGPTEAPRPRRRPRWSGRWTCSPPDGWSTRPRSVARTCCPRSPSRTGPRSVLCMTPAIMSRRWTRLWTRRYYAELRKEQAERRASGDVRQLGIGLASYVEITGMGDGEESPPEEHGDLLVDPDGTATILTGTSSHGQGHATAGDARQRGARHPGRQDHAEVGRH